MFDYKTAHTCPPDGHHGNGRCAGFCSACNEHMLLTGRYTSYCPSCDVCPECGCPRADGFAHYTDCPAIHEEDE